MQTEYQSQYKSWGQQLHRPKPRHYSGANHYYDSGIQQAQTTEHQLRPDRFEHQHFKDEKENMERLTKYQLKRPQSAAVADPSHQEKFAWLTRMADDATQTPWQVNKQEADAYSPEKYVQRMPDYDNLYGSPPRSISVSPDRGRSPGKTTYDLAKELLSRASSRSSSQRYA